MKRFMSPAYFAVAVICFFLPFVSVSCDAGALNETFGGEGVEGVEIPGGGVIEYEVSGWQIVTNDPPEFEGLEGLEELGGQQQPAAEDDFPGRIFAIIALAAAVLGIGLSLLSGRLGPALSVALGALGAISLFLLRGALTDRLGPAAILGVEVGYKLGYWLALLMFVAAAAVGIWRLVSERPAAATAYGLEEPPAPGTAPPGTAPPPGAPPPGAPPPPSTEPPPPPPTSPPPP